MTRAPWEDRQPRHGDHDTLARALEADGATVVDHRDGGVQSEYLYDCGCRRLYVVRDRAEKEVLFPCPVHGNLLTTGAIQQTMGMDRGPAGKEPEAAGDSRDG